MPERKMKQQQYIHCPYSLDITLNSASPTAGPIGQVVVSYTLMGRGAPWFNSIKVRRSREISIYHSLSQECSPLLSSDPSSDPSLRPDSESDSMLIRRGKSVKMPLR